MDTLFQTGLNFCFPSALLTCTGAETVHDTTVAITACIDGKLTPRATIADGATPTVDFTTGAAFRPMTANQGCVVVWALQGATVRCMQGPIQALDGSGNFLISPQFPTVPDTVAPFAYQVLKAGSTAGTVTFGTSNWNATGYTNVIQNIAVLPSRPQVA